MTEVVESKGPQDAPKEQTTDQAPTNGPSVLPSPTPKAAEMVSDATLTEGPQDETMIDAPAEPDDADSEAETLIQSPEKQRTTTDNTSVAGSASATRNKDEDSTAGATATDMDNKSRKRKRSVDNVQDGPASSTSSRRSSPLSSPRIPPHSPDSDSDVSNHIASRKPKSARRKLDSDPVDSDDPAEKSVKNQTRRRRPSDILPPISKHRTKNGSGGVDPGSSERRETRSATYPRHSSQDRSPSPSPKAQKREHRRGVSTQFTLGDVERKKRGRPPAINTKRSGSADNNRTRSSSSEDDSDSHQQTQPASHKFSSIDHDTMSPAKVSASGPRKWRDKNGRTFLSRAASNNDLGTARIRFQERPEDLNQPDNAGNTPLQIAALQGYVDIVRFLLENGCEVDTRNIDRDTALIDAVENGHVEVIKLLLDHGANPRLGNAKGDEPYELVPQDDENYKEIRKLLADAKEKPTNRRISAEQNDATRDGASSRAASAASPRDSPPIGPRSPPAGFGRRRTGRSESTRNDLLWQANTQENLKKLASQGDVQGVANILNVLQKAETESLIAAAKAGHEEVLQYLLAMGNTDPDPDPIRHLKVGYNTPLLAAIGRGHPEVVKLLVEQSGFNPMRKLLKGKAYYEISAERRGEQWKKEHDILKAAYDKYAVKHRKTMSPRTTRDSDKPKARTNRRSQSPISSKLRNSSSPTLMHKQLPGKSPRSLEKERDREMGSGDGTLTEKRKHHAPRREIADSSIAVASDQDQTINAPRKGHVKKRSQSDFSQLSNLDSEVTHRRRRLVTGKEHRRRRSNVEGSSDEEMVTVKAEGKPNALLKRTRESVSPGSTVTVEGDGGRSAAKKRRTVVESSPEETRPGPRKGGTASSSPIRERKAQEPVQRTEGSQEDATAPEEPVEAMNIDEPEPAKQVDLAGASAPAPEKDIPLQRTETTEQIKAEPIETGPTEAEIQAQREAEEEEAARKAEEARRLEEAKRLEEERIAAEKAAEEQRLAEEAERVRKAEEEAALRKKEEEERQERLRRELEERKRRHEEQLKEQQRRQEEMLREQQKRERLEAEKRRRDALPALLKHSAWLLDNNDPIARSEAWLKLFLPLYTVKSLQLDPNTPDGNANDLWIPNFQVAGLLATKDLHLRNYTSLETRPVTPPQRQRLWNVARNSLAYEFQTNQWNTTIKQAIQREQEERPKFYAMEELFWVKVCPSSIQRASLPY